MEQQERQPELIIVLGTNGTGKTTIVKKMVINEIKSESGQALIVVPDDMEWPSIPWVHPKFITRINRYVKVRKLIYFDGLLDIIRIHFRYGLVVFDDCRVYFRATTDKDLEGFLIRRRQQMADIMVVAHGFSKVPPAFFAYATKIILFKTRDNIDSSRRDVLENYAEMKEAQARINQRADDKTKAWTESGKIEDNSHYYEIIKI